MSSPNVDGLNGRQTVVVVVSAICIVAPTIAVGLRFFSRRLCREKLWWDDCFCAIALILAYGPCICAIWAVRHGLGRHSDELNSSDFVQIFKIFYPLQITWTFNFGFTYAAIALMYVRHFPATMLAKVAVVMGVIGMLTAIVDAGFLIWQCTPVAFVWNKSIPGGHCINQHRAYTTAASLILALVFVLFFLPLPTLYGMHMSTTKKLGLTLTLSMGAFVCITSVFCLVNILQMDNQDISWSASPANAWACLGSSFGVAVACLPSLRPLFSVLRKRRKRNSRSGGDGLFADGSRSKPRSRRLGRMIDRRKSSATFSERIDLQTRTHPPPDDHDDRARLVDGNIKPNDILITRQVLQVTETAHPKDLENQRKEDGILPQAWRARSPPP